MIQAVRLIKSYGKEPVLRELSLTVDTGCIACVIGRNGSGKSTLLSILAGRLLPDSGEIRVNGYDIHGKERPGIGYLTQNDGLFDDLSVAQNILFWASAAKVKKSEMDRFADLMALKPFWRKKVRALSGGMRRRAAICAVLLHNPSCLLLDEPFNGLDLVHKEELLEYLGRIRGEGKTLLYTAHNAEEIGRLADRIIVLHQGRADLVPWDGADGNPQSSIIKLLKGEQSNE